MTDRCSAEVAIVPSYGDKFDAFGTVLLNRGSDGRTEWTAPFSVRLSDGRPIRWWCHSIKENWLDPGTWRWRDGSESEALRGELAENNIQSSHSRPETLEYFQNE